MQWRKGALAGAVLAAGLPVAAAAADLDDNKLIDLWAQERLVCSEGDQDRTDTWASCGRMEAFAVVLAARGFCLDGGQDVWRTGSAAKAVGEPRWRCRLVSS